MNVIAQQGDTLDALCYRHYGRTEGVVEAVLLVNPVLAEVGVILPHGTAVTLPVIDTAPQSETVQLWD
ncbi:Phage Tail Protein X [Serratia marcescens]|uniref:tail protein X n=1 Tax=Serratia TaxID=613 RepID=UPI000744FF8A|nr:MULTISPECIES: tail protein X [Serratia]MBJ2066957.1 tail protein X [Serratia odorifera]CVC02876.1 Phage Tail Protein X [Serratia marcescens]CVH14660.1 Phage Tail Protein X [Serratia marcescens]